MYLDGSAQWGKGGTERRGDTGGRMVLAEGHAFGLHMHTCSAACGMSNGPAKPPMLLGPRLPTPALQRWCGNLHCQDRST